ncbi:hypothetical protein HYZ41_04440 [archaeon]|nr:hypothetical protein [archaeon]
MGKHMNIKKRILFSVLVFFVLLLLFVTYAITLSCPVVSCDTTGNCTGNCYSYVNIPVFLALVVVAIVLPAIVFKIYKRL